MKRACCQGVLIAIICLIRPATASAHLVNTGFGPFYNGLCHPFVNPTDVMIVLTLSLLAGFAGAAEGRGILFSLTLAWMAGFLFGENLQIPNEVAPLIYPGVILVVSLLVVFNVRCPWTFLILASVIIGLVFGGGNGREFTDVEASFRVTGGIAVAIFVVAALAASFAVKNSDGWRRIVIRVAGSWIAAASLLMIGWELRNAFDG